MAENTFYTRPLDQVNLHVPDFTPKFKDGIHFTLVEGDNIVKSYNERPVHNRLDPAGLAPALDRWNRQVWSNDISDKLARGELKDTQYDLTPNEILAIEQEILHVLRFELVTPLFATVKNIGKGVLEWKYTKWNDVVSPRWTQTFQGRRPVATSKVQVIKTLIGVDYDYYISRIQLDNWENANRLEKFSESLQQGTMT